MRQALANRETALAPNCCAAACFVVHADIVYQKVQPNMPIYHSGTAPLPHPVPPSRQPQQHAANNEA